MEQIVFLTFLYVLGLTVGVLCALAFTIVWMLFASSLLEIVYEFFSREYVDTQPETLEKALINNDAQAILISDLHADRWDADDANLQSLTKFMTLLKEYPQIEECIINGDLADFPEKVASSILERDLGSLDMHESTATLLVSRCVAILSIPKIPLSIVLGNHDLSLHGLRNAHSSSAILPGSLKQFWDGILLLKTQNSRAIAVEHGHRYDPLLTLYTAYRTLDIARNAQLDQASDFYEQLASSRHIRREKRGFMTLLHEYIVKLRYRRAARFNRYGASAVTFGHTHIADRFLFNSNCVYVNTGSWEPNRGGYIAIVTRTGTIWGPYRVG